MNTTRKIETLTLAMRNGAVGIGGYPTRVRALVVDRDGDRIAYVSRRVYRTKIANDNLVCGVATDGTPIIEGQMNNLRKLADARTWETGREHVVVMRPHGLSVVSARFAKLCNYTII